MSQHDPGKATLVAFSSHTTDKMRNTFMEVVEESNRQDDKWGREFPGRKHAFWMNTLVEEVGEVAETILKGQEEDMKTELIQCAAVIFAWLELRDGTPEDEVENIEEHLSAGEIMRMEQDERTRRQQSPLPPGTQLKGPGY